MIVQYWAMFDEPTPADADDLHDAALEVTNEQLSVRVFADQRDPCWLIAEFTMATMAQYAAVNVIDRSFGFEMLRKIDSKNGFPKDRARKPRKRKAPTVRRPRVD